MPGRNVNRPRVQGEQSPCIRIMPDGSAVLMPNPRKPRHVVKRDDDNGRYIIRDTKLR